MLTLFKKLIPNTEVNSPALVPYSDTERALADWEALLKGAPRTSAPKSRDFLAEIL